MASRTQLLNRRPRAGTCWHKPRAGRAKKVKIVKIVRDSKEWACQSVLTDEERAMKKRILANVEKYKIRDPETRRYEYEQNQAKRDPEKRTAIKRAVARERRREEAAERRREARLTDSYALYAHDSFGQSDDGFEPHERMRVKSRVVVYLPFR